MAEVPFENLGAGGIVRDKKDHTLPPEIWTGGKNVRFIEDEFRKFLGSEEIFPSWDLSGSGGPNELPLYVRPWRSQTDAYWLLCTDQYILRATSATIADVTRASGLYTTDTDKIWSGGIIGGVPVLNNDAGDDPQSWDAGTVKFVDLPNWPANTSCKIMRVFKQYLVAYDITESGLRQPHSIKWSSAALPGSVPSFWDNAISNDSEESPLSEGGGFLVDAEPLGDINIIYKEELTYGMEFIGGPFVFRFYKLPFQSGLYAPRCVKEFFGKHFAVTRGDVIIHNGQEAESVIDDYNRNYLFDNMKVGKERKTFVVPNYTENEMWICFVSNGVDGNYADEALVYNWKKNTWGHRQLGGVPHIARGLLDKTAVSKIIDDQDQFIDDDESLIDGAAFAAGKQRLVGSQESTANSKLVEFDISNTEQGTNMASEVERTGLTIVGVDRQGNPKVDPTATKFVRRIYPKLQGSSTIDVYVGSQQKLEGSTSYLGPFAFDPTTDNHIDVRVQGKAICVKFASTESVSWSGTGFVLDMDVIGESNR